MKKLMRRKMFNTSNSEKLVSVHRGRGDSYYRETLYRSHRGDFFLHGKGGTLTMWGGSENLRVLAMSGESTLPVKHWLETHGQDQSFILSEEVGNVKG